MGERGKGTLFVHRPREWRERERERERKRQREGEGGRESEGDSL